MKQYAIVAAASLFSLACGDSGGSSGSQNGSAGGGWNPTSPVVGQDPVASGGGGVPGSGGSGSVGAPGGTPGVGAPPPGGGSGGTPGGAPPPPPPSGAGGTPASPPPTPGVNTITLTMKSFQVNPGDEVFMCQNYDNPFGGQDAAVQQVVTDMSQGSHHLHIFYGTTSTNRDLESCSGLEFHPLLHAAGKPHAETIYPSGMAAKVRGETGLRLQVHYLNTSTDVLTVNVSAKLTTVDPATIDKWIAELYFNRIGLSVPPGQQTITTSCSIPASYGQIGLIGGGSHMHSRGVHFVATTSTGAPLVDTTEWAEPAAVPYDPPVILNPGDSISWSCTYNNTTGRTLTFGESAATNEMCIYLARFYSSPTGADLECQSYFATGVAAPSTTQ